MKGIAELVAPLSKAEFLSKYSQEKPVYIEGDESKVDGLFSWDKASEMLTYSRQSMDGFRMIYDKQNLPTEQFRNYLYWLKKGATMVINNLDKLTPEVFELANSLEMEMNTKVNTNCYMSYPSVQGFNTHFDQHDVFAVQISGEKTWSIYEATKLSPTHIMGKSDEQAPEGEPDEMHTLTPGDVLYIPRGYWHHALADSASIHLTVGPCERTPIHFLNTFVYKLMQNEEWYRRDFPLIDAVELGGHVGGLENYFEEFVDRTITHMKSPAFFESFLEFVQQENGNRRPLTDLKEFWEIENSLTPADEFRFNELQKAILRFDPDTGQAVAMIRGHVVNLAGVNAEILDLIFESKKSFNGEMLMSMGDISWEQARKILITMYQQAICIKL